MGLLFLSIFIFFCFWLSYWPSKFFIFWQFLSFFVFLVPPWGLPLYPFTPNDPKIEKYIAIPFICHPGDHSVLENGELFTFEVVVKFLFLRTDRWTDLTIIMTKDFQSTWFNETFRNVQYDHYK